MNETPGDLDITPQESAAEWFLYHGESHIPAYFWN
jgi:hypothetical protein